MASYDLIIRIVDTLLNVDRFCGDFDRCFRPDGPNFRFDYGNECFLVTASERLALSDEYRVQVRHSLGLVIASALFGLLLAIGADLASDRASPVWLTLSLLLGPVVAAGIALWLNLMRKWTALVEKMRRNSTPAKDLAPTPTP